MAFEYFGPAKFRKEYETQIETPAGLLCCHCEEAIQPGDVGTMQGSKPLHYECGMRLVLGSVGHQMKKCSCFGGTEEDPPGMTKRQAAIAAVEHWASRPSI